MQRLILFILAILMLVFISSTYEDDYYIIPNDSIRIRIIPNSNSVKDQYIKNKVRKELEKHLYNDLKESKDINTSRNIINDNINEYHTITGNVLKSENIEQPYNIEYGYHYFPEKVYKGVKYEKGQYESLLITIGDGKGDNWWCVLFPPICAFEEDGNNTKDKEYSFFIKEMFNKYAK